MSFVSFDRLKRVQDICPLPGFPSHDATIWKGKTAKSKVPVMEHPNGYTVTDFSNRFITWHRTFTRDHDIPALSAPSIIHIHEWVPSTEPAAMPGFVRFGMHHFEAVAMVRPNASKHWSTQARRHLAAAKKNPHLALRLGTLAEVQSILAVSQVPKTLRPVFITFTQRHLNIHPQDLDILVATLHDKPVAAFIAGYCASAQESTYLVGCFSPEGGKAQAMTALVERWFERCLEKHILHANFGDIVGPRAFPFDDAIGYSNFKTHFNVHRVWLPGSRWKIRLSLQFLHHLFF